MAAGLNLLGKLGQLDNGSTDTAKFVLKMDQLLDIFSTNKLKSLKKWRRGFYISEERVEYLNELSVWIQSWDLVNSTSPIYCKGGMGLKYQQLPWFVGRS